MTILESTTAPYLFLIAGFFILLGFFRKLLVRVLAILAVEILLFVLYPQLLLTLVKLVNQIRQSLG